MVEDDPKFWRAYFQMAWFNHQPVTLQGRITCPTEQGSDGKSSTQKCETVGDMWSFPGVDTRVIQCEFLCYQQMMFPRRNGREYTPED